MWDKESKRIIMEASKPHCKNPAFKKLAKMLPQIDGNIQDACLRLYLHACQHRHALAFF